jgi:hypothetical protein
VRISELTGSILEINWPTEVVSLIWEEPEDLRDIAEDFERTLRFDVEKSLKDLSEAAVTKKDLETSAAILRMSWPLPGPLLFPPCVWALPDEKKGDSLAAVLSRNLWILWSFVAVKICCCCCWDDEEDGDGSGEERETSESKTRVGVEIEWILVSFSWARRVLEFQWRFLTRRERSAPLETRMRGDSRGGAWEESCLEVLEELCFSCWRGPEMIEKWRLVIEAEWPSVDVRRTTSWVLVVDREGLVFWDMLDWSLKMWTILSLLPEARKK